MSGRTTLFYEQVSNDEIANDIAIRYFVNFIQPLAREYEKHVKDTWNQSLFEMHYAWSRIA